MNQKERRLLEEIQFNFPLSPRPYLEIARRIGFSEAEVISKTRSFKKKGIVRYIGAVFNLKALGFSSTLIAARVPTNRMKRAVKVINKYPQVSHNYLRDGEFNLWFTVSAPSASRLLGIVREIKKRAGIRDVLNLSPLRVFKIDARFKLLTSNQEAI
jgi:DNA-binding Lrp family transcriptional regulator